jgi:hypothetical protein
VSFLLRHGIRWFLPVLRTQSLFLAAAGERTPVISSAITLILVLARVRVRPSGKQVVTAILLTAVVVLAIAGFAPNRAAPFSRAIAASARGPSPSVKT